MNARTLRATIARLGRHCEAALQRASETRSPKARHRFRNEAALYAEVAEYHARRISTN